jgi:iron complex transport system ATP-binding protein
MSTTALSLKGIGFTRQGRQILSGIDLDVAAGNCCAIMGPNGSGKSTLIAIISGYLWPTTGEVRVFGRAYGRVDLRSMRRSIGLIETSRAPAFPEYMNVREIVATGLFGLLMLPIDQELSRPQWRKVDAEMAALGIEGFASCPLAELSSGEQMKVLIARAMVASPRLVVLDEPTAGLDMRARAQVVETLDGLRRARPATIVIVSHHLDELPGKVDKVVLIREGRTTACGKPAAVLTSRRLSEAFGCRVTVTKKDGRYMAAVRSSRP